MKDYHSNEECNHILHECTDAPKYGWIIEAYPLNEFRVPCLDINSENEICIVDGRHRFLWMKNMGMSTIPVAITEKTEVNMLSKNISFNKCDDSLDIPWEFIQNEISDAQNNTINVEKEARNLIMKLKCMMGNNNP
ncbi:TPA: hypothetical protein JFZ54_000502 [Klebsiella oxytoca]|uniref:hypothetical protein n=1 Tax=Klebsiella oxytoca TaxID=571 RepID=UPI00066514B7|nr:hypothetical protein [Klebsiella oxytoca]HAV0429302.1 hypothetical protein [Klebsiella oxytoca]